MAEKPVVSSVQVEAARYWVGRAAKQGKTTSSAVERIANAAKSSLPATAVMNVMVE